MQEQWQAYSNKFLAITPREQILIFVTGFCLIVFIFYHFFIDGNLTKAKVFQKNITELTTSTQSVNASISNFNILLARNPNKDLQEKIAQYEAELNTVDGELLTLTSELIHPIEMRKALVELLNLEKGVSLVSFELLGAKQVVSPEQSSSSDEDAADTQVAVKTQANKQGLSLYKHGIKIKLTGRYFHLRDYLRRFEMLSWKFFWQGFDYHVQEYPNSELEIEIYSLSTRKEFIGV